MQHDGGPAPIEATPAAAPGERLPWTDLFCVAALVLFHLSLVAWSFGAFPGGESLLRRGGLIAGHVADEPWRLVSAIFLHVDPRHALYNGLSMLVFSIPLLTWVGYPRTATIYLAAGIGGGIAAGEFAPQGTIIVGSSGAVAGLFGAWVVVSLRSARFTTLRWRKWVRTLGIAFLMLPSLISPMTRSGQPISVSAHLGGMATGMLIGVLLSSNQIPREVLPFDDDPDDPDEPDDARWRA